jgi:hypothetical protein
MTCLLPPLKPIPIKERASVIFVDPIGPALPNAETIGDAGHRA